MPRTTPKTVKVYPLELNRILNIANQAIATGEAQVGDLRWFDLWLMQRIKRRACKRWGPECWVDYPPKNRPGAQPEPAADEPAVTVFVTAEAAATPDEIMAAIARRAEELLGTPEGMAKALAPEPWEKGE